jgi:carbamoyltransferase
MVVLGLGFTDHEASAALVIDGELRTAIARERLTRLKRDGNLFGSRKLDLSLAIRYCLEEHHLALGDVDLLVWNHVDHLCPKKLTVLLALEGSMDFSRIPLLVLPHHFAHACASFYLSPFPEAAVLVADGNGGSMGGLLHDCQGPEPESIRNGSVLVQNFLTENTETARELESFYYCDGRQWSTLRKIVGDCDGIGARYGAVSSLLFENPLDAGKTMGLAPYGTLYDRPSFLEQRGPEDMLAFQATHGPGWADLKQQIKRWRKAPGRPDYQAELPSNFAATIQHESEEAMLTHARWLRRGSDSTNLCLSGGVALNCVANSCVAQQAGFDSVFVPPAPGDDGIAAGCALYGAALHGELRRGSCPVFLGRSYTHDANELKVLGLVPASPGQAQAELLAERIADGAVVAWFQKGAEFGPRALGHRSFLADPRSPIMRDHLNKVVKNRESFRPFAPVVLEDAVLDYFEESHPSYYMSFVASVRPEKRSVVPAITHVDGSARYQVLRKTDNPELHELIAAFAKRTGVPLLLNTSLNRAAEPIVETPLEAARCMLAASVNFLVLDGVMYGRTG